MAVKREKEMEMLITERNSENKNEKYSKIVMKKTIKIK